MVLTNPFRLIVPPQSARHLRARLLSASLTAVTTAENVVASSAGSTHPSRSVLTNLHASTQRANCTGLATAATAHSASGSICVRAAPTARARIAALPLFRSKPLPCPNDQRICVWAALHKASRVPGIGAPFEPALRDGGGAVNYFQ